jgi:hypothetical protein
LTLVVDVGRICSAAEGGVGANRKPCCGLLPAMKLPTTWPALLMPYGIIKVVPEGPLRVV